MNKIKISKELDNELINIIKKYIEDMNIDITDQHISKFIYNNIKKSINDIDNIHHDYVLKDSIFNNYIKESIFFDKKIINNIYNNLHYVYNIKFFYKNINFFINIYFDNEINVEKYIEIIKLIICICLKNKVSDNKEEFIFDLYLTDEKKHFNYKFPNCIESYNINSGYSRFSNNMYICIYRKEEWVKVFIHECLHTFNLDFHDELINFKNLFSSLFNCSSEFNMNESFVEFWARIFNCGIFTYFLKKNISFKDFNTLFKLNINIEMIYSIIQANKLLNKFELNYNKIIDKNNKIIIYKENTNAFCYYVITSILLFNFEKVIKWFNMYNSSYFDCIKNEREVMIFCYFIKEISVSKNVIDIFDKIQKLDVDNNDFLKMTCLNIEL